MGGNRVYCKIVKYARLVVDLGKFKFQCICWKHLFSIPDSRNNKKSIR